MVYEILFWTGLVGIVVILLMRRVPGMHNGGRGHLGGGHHAGGGHGNVGGSHSVGHHGTGQSHGAHNSQGRAGVGSQTSSGLSAAMIGLGVSLLSPLAIDSLLLGTGATGMILRNARMAPSERAEISFVAGVLYFFLVVRPLFGLIFKFASQPSAALDGSVGAKAEVLRSFDSSRIGLVRLQIDGQNVRMLAVLSPEETELPEAIRPGDILTVIAVDGRRNRCTVMRL